MQFLQIQDPEPFPIESLDERLKLINFYLMLEPTLCPAPLVRLDYPPPTAPHRRGPPQPLQAPHRRSPALPMQVRQYLVPPGWYGTVEPTLDPLRQFQRVTVLGLQRSARTKSVQSCWPGDTTAEGCNIEGARGNWGTRDQGDLAGSVIARSLPKRTRT